jgi:protease-4
MKKFCLFLFIVFTLVVIISAVVVLSERAPIGQKVAIVRIEGPIVDSKETIDEIKGYLKNSSVKAIVLRVDSPGGAVAPSQEIYEEVKRASKQKKVVASMGTVAASGGYYISSPATKVFANPGTLTGSIGVIMEIPNIEGLMDKIGVKTEVIKSGKHKDMASIFRKMKEEDRKILQGVIEDVHEQFIIAVAEGRRLPIEKVREIADGRVFTGRQAKEIGLVDELGNLEDAIKEAARLSGIKGEPEVITKKDRFTFLDVIRGKLSGTLKEAIPTFGLKYMLTP